MSDKKMKIEKRKKIILAGITPSGTIHLGNYVSVVHPTVELVKESGSLSYCFIADYHSLIKLSSAVSRTQYVYEIAAMWMSLEPKDNKFVIYKQSDIPEITEINWIMTCVTSKGIMNRAHAYKKMIASKIENVDESVNMGLFNYPILMTADILASDADIIPIGQDQVQHIEIANHIIKNFNKSYGRFKVKLSAFMPNKANNLIPGTDGKKMSKSYNNIIPLFASSNELYKSIMKIVTNSQTHEEPKCPRSCTIFSLFKYFSEDKEICALNRQYKNGISWSTAKKMLFENIEAKMRPFREKYRYLLENKSILRKRLKDDAEKAREGARRTLHNMKKLTGI